MKARAITLILLAALTIQIEAQSYVPSTMTIGFTPGLQYTDGVALNESEITKYDVYCDGAWLRIEPNDFTRTFTVTVDDLGAGDHTCGLSETVGGMESIISDTMSFPLGQRTPGAPTLTTAVGA